MKPWVIKIGGAALSHPSSIAEVAKSVAYLTSIGQPVVLVHGGGPLINQKLQEKNIKWTFHEGQRVTTPEMMSGIEEGLGEVNLMITQALSKLGVKNIGLPGNQDQMYSCVQMNPSLGLVGEIIGMNVKTITEALKQGITPVIAPMGVDNEGQSFNINADWGASHLAVALGARVLLYCTDQYGILDINGLPYDSLTLAQLRILMEKEGVSGGMLAKARTIDFAISSGVEKVSVIHALQINELVAEKKSTGTLCVGMSRLEYFLKLQEVAHVI
jgi:acetylglutamate kinase